jgi:two-component system, NarL family, nitrate/nitrite response regulator NarL
MLKQMTVRALIVDDNREFLQAAREMLEREGINVVAVASTGAQALSSAGEHDPDVVLLDIGLGDESGFDVAMQLTAAGGRARRIVLISARSEEDLQDLIDQSPAIGFVAKSRLSAPAILGLLDPGNGSGPSER